MVTTNVFMQTSGVWEAVDSAGIKPLVETRTDKIGLATIYEEIPKDNILSVCREKID